MKRLLLATALCSALLSCEKDKTPAYTPAPNTGTLRYTNTSSNPYTIYLDGSSKGSLAGDHHTDITTSAGNHTVKAVQESGYILYPTERTGTVNVPKGGDVEFIFP